MSPMEESPETVVPQKIGKWRVVRALGKGGMAEVYEVEDEKLGSRYALKLFTYDRAEREMARMRFFSEGRLLAKLDHPRLVRVYEVEEDPASGRPYFVMDLVLSPDGKPRTLAEVETPDEDQVAMWYEDLRSGLDYIHGKGILHRDLKLQNVLLGSDGHAVLSDFGVAKIFDPSLRIDLGLSAEQTLIAAKGGQKTVMGSVGYLAPEVEMGVAASKESDWYALGVLIFRLLTGVWCDARTDVVGDLESYSPTWLKILPKLLHLNPAGRECPSWTELERARREEEAYRAEQLYLEARDKLRRAKASKKWLVGVIAAGLTMMVIGAVWFAVWRHLFRLPTFDELCVIPADVPAAVSDDDDVASRAFYRLAQTDAWFLTRDILGDVDAGRKTRASAVVDIRRLVQRLRQEEEEIFGQEYESLSEEHPEALIRLLSGMADRLEGKETP